MGTHPVVVVEQRRGRGPCSGNVDRSLHSYHKADAGSQAVAKYGQKWDQVQKALPQRGYHQVRQRWLRRLRAYPGNKAEFPTDLAFAGTMENNKAVETASNSPGGATTGQAVNGNGGANPDPPSIPNPKLGMAPLSSEIAVAASSNVPGENHQPLNPPPPGPSQPTDPPNTDTFVPPAVDALPSDPASTSPTQVSTIPMPSEPERASQANDPQPSLPNPTPTADLPEQVHLPNPDPVPSGSSPAEPPTNIDSHPPHTANAPEEGS